MCFGCRHSRDPQDPQVDLVRRDFAVFIETTTAPNRIAFVEGGGWPVAATDVQTIESYGEAAYLTLLAGQYGVQATSADASIESSVAHLREAYPDNLIAYHLVARQLTSEIEELTARVTHADVEKAFQRLPRTLRSNMPRTLAETHARLYGGQLVGCATDFFLQVSDPTKVSGPSNSVARSLSIYRDTLMAQAIIEKWREGLSVFALFGFSHVIMQRPLIDRALGAQESSRP